MTGACVPVGRGQQAETPLRGIFCVPAIRYRLSFAILVQRALRELHAARPLDPARDVVAVALPERLAKVPRSPRDGSGSGSMRSAGSVLDRALERLPDVSLLFVKTGEEEIRELIAVTPCDAMTEAVRSAREWGVPTELVDVDIAPGHLGLRNCTEDPSWPDDELALVYGAQWYLDRIEPLLQLPPSRLEPVDTWREAHMTERLRELHSFYERVLFVCDATHLEPIRHRLHRPAQDVSTVEQRPRIRVDLLKPAPALRLHFLDDMPRLVEIYERERSDGRGRAFTKVHNVLRAIRELDEQSPDISYSIRRYLAYATFLRRRLAFEGRHAPRLEHVVDAAGSCFDAMFAARIRRHLLGYFDKVDADLVGPATPGPEATESGAGGQLRVVSRGCNPLGRWFVVARPWRVRGSGSTRPLVWSPWKEHATRMRAKALRVQPVARRDVRVTKYQGALRGGIDLRRTLRSHLGRDPAIYVKDQVRRRRATEGRDTPEPVVWLYEPELPFTSSWTHSSIWIGYGVKQERGLTGCWHSYTSRLIGLAHERFTIEKFCIMGKVFFSPLSSTRREIQEAYGDEILRVPRFRTVDPVLRPLDQSLRAGSDWPRILLEGGLAFAKRRLVVVCPTRYSIPKPIVELANASGKRIDKVPLSRFTTEEIRKLRAEMVITGPHEIPPDMDRNDPAFLEQVYTRFKGAVAPFW